jgi:hypothetical protein
MESSAVQLCPSPGAEPTGCLLVPTTALCSHTGMSVKGTVSNHQMSFICTPFTSEAFGNLPVIMILSLEMLCVSGTLAVLWTNEQGTWVLCVWVQTRFAGSDLRGQLDTVLVLGATARQMVS